MPDLNLFIPITKVDAAKRLVYGIATAEIEDKSGEICDYASTKPNYEKWSGDCAKTTGGKSYGNVRSMHGPVAAGKVTSISFNDPEKQIEICAKVVDDAEWLKVQEGVYTGFSQGGSYERRWTDDAGLQRYTANPSEISLVDLPCLQNATFQMIKADGGTEARRFKEKENASMSSPNDAIIARAKQLAKAAGNEAAWSQHIEAATASLAKDLEVGDGSDGKDGDTGDDGNDHKESGHKGGKGGKGGSAKGKFDGGDGGDGEDASEDRDGRDGEDGKAAGADGDGADGRHGKDMESADKAAKNAINPRDGVDWEQVWLSKRDGKTFQKKDDLRAHLAQLDAVTAMAGTTEPVLQALDDLGKQLGLPCGKTAESVEKHDFSDEKRKKLAESGAAKPDGSYPIETAKDVENAVKDFGRSNGSASDKAHIIARAKAIGAESSLPDDWIDKLTQADDLTKAYPKLTSENKDRIAAMHEHTSALMDKCMKAERFSASDMDKIAACGNHCSNLMGQQYDPENGQMARAMAVELEKLGARHSADDIMKIQALHDKAVELGAKCGADGGMAMAAMTTDLEKRTAENAALQATITEMLPRINEIAAAVKKIEAQPLPLPLSGATRAVEKGHHLNAGMTAQQESELALTDPEVIDRLATSAIRAAQARGLSYHGARGVR